MSFYRSIHCSVCGAPGVGTRTDEGGVTRSFCSTHMCAPDGRLSLRTVQTTDDPAGVAEGVKKPKIG
jgi:hypothetical protein